MRAVVFQEWDNPEREHLVSETQLMWIIQALDQDICVSAADLHVAIDRFEAVLRAELDIQSKLAFKPVSKAPQEYFDMWDKKKTPFQHRGYVDDIMYVMAICD